MAANKASAKVLSLTESLLKLKLFDEKIETVKRGRFVGQVFGQTTGFEIHFHADKPLMVEKTGADEDAVLAVAATIRFFVQERDGVSVWQIANIYESLPVEDMAKTSARAAVNGIDRLLDEPSGLCFNGMQLTNRRIFEVFMYGGLAHANEDKRIEYELWTRGPFAGAMQSLFEDIVARMLQIILSFHQMNERTIRALT